MKTFHLTFSVVTEESAQHGDHARHGFVTRNLTIPDRTYLPKRPAEFRLREAIEFLLDRSSEGPVEADSSHLSPQSPPRWFTYGGGWNEDNESIQISLHLPRDISGHSAMRIARLLHCYGIKPRQQNANSIL